MDLLGQAYTPPPNMPTQLDPVRLSQALQELGVTPASLHAIRSALPEKARLMLDELKLVAKSRYRKLAKELHPDTNGGDAAKTEKFSFLSQVIKQIDMMEIRPNPPPPPPFIPRGPQPGQVIRHVIFRATPVVGVQPRPGPVTAGAPTRVPHGIHVVFLRPT